MGTMSTEDLRRLGEVLRADPGSWAAVEAANAALDAAYCGSETGPALAAETDAALAAMEAWEAWVDNR